MPRLRPWAATSVVLLVLTSAAVAEAPVDEALSAAAKAYNAGDYSQAARRYREIVEKFNAPPDARVGLARTLLDQATPDFAGACDQLLPLVSDVARPDRAWIRYWLGTALCGRASKEADSSSARRSFEEALGHLAAAVGGSDADLSARARCDQADVELRLGQSKKARESVAPALKSARHGTLALYLHGFACYLEGDLNAAGRSLNQAVAANDPVFGPHARYLLGRVYHRGGETAEALEQYEAAVADYLRDKQAAGEALKKPDPFRTHQHEKVRLEALARSPTPDHILRAGFYAGQLRFEAGQFADALARFTPAAQSNLDPQLAAEALLRIGICHVEMKQAGPASDTLRRVAVNHARLADQAYLWLARAQFTAADPNNPSARFAASRAALDALRQAAEKNQQRGGDADARFRRGEIGLELADVLLQAQPPRPKEAAEGYERLLADNLLPGRTEEVLVRLAAAWQAAGDYARSDAACARFRREFPQSSLTAAVAFREAENAYFAGAANAQQRLKAFIDQYPEFDRLSQARYTLGLIDFRQSAHEKAQEVLEAIPAPDRTGDLIFTPYLIAECLIRQAPEKADDALAAGRLQEQLGAAAQLLDGFAAAYPKEPEGADAMLKLGYCQARLAGLLADANERAAAYNIAKLTFDRLRTQFPNGPLAAQAYLERCKVKITYNRSGAADDLRRFFSDPLLSSPAAPLAAVMVATILREQGQAVEAAKLLADFRQKREAELLRDPAQGDRVALVRFHHALALQALDKPEEALLLFEQATGPEALVRAGQCKMAEARRSREKLLPRPAEAVAVVEAAVKYCLAKADTLKEIESAAESRARLVYEAAWGYRLLAVEEIKAAVRQSESVAVGKYQETHGKERPAPPVTVARAVVALQPSEEKARLAYRQIIKEVADAPLANDARFELAELLAERDELPPAAELLGDALDKEPPAALGDAIRLRLGACLAAQKKAKPALAQFEALTQDPKNPLAAQAVYRIGECLIDSGDDARAVERLSAFRDRGEFQNHPGLTDRALYRLGEALGRLKQRDRSRQAFEQVVQRFGNGALAGEARYQIGRIWLQQGRFDEAAQAFAQVNPPVPGTELAARAQFQLGVCRLEQQRFAEAAPALLKVAADCDYPEWTAAALTEAGRAYAGDKKPDEAAKVWLRVVNEYSDSPWAKAAQERLERLKKG